MTNVSHLKKNPYPDNLILDMGLDPVRIYKEEFIKAIELLSDSDIDIIDCRYKDFLDTSDIADIMGMTNAQAIYKFNKAFEEIERIYDNATYKRVEYDKKQDEIIQNIINDYANMPVEEIIMDNQTKEKEEMNNSDNINSVFDVDIHDMELNGLSHEIATILRKNKLHTMSEIVSFVNEFGQYARIILGIDTIQASELIDVMHKYDVYVDNSFACSIMKTNSYISGVDDVYYGTDLVKKEIGDSLNEYMTIKMNTPVAKPEDRYVKFGEDTVDFVSEFINWGFVSAIVKMSPEFIERNEDKLDMYSLSFNRYLTQEFVEKHLDDYEFRSNLINLFLNGVVSLQFINIHGTKNQLKYCVNFKKTHSGNTWLRNI